MTTVMTTTITTVTQLTRCFDLWQRYHRRSHKPLCNCQTLAWWWLSVMTRIMGIMKTPMMMIRSPAEAVMTHKRDWDDNTDDQIIMKGIVMTAMTMMITTCRCWTQPMLQSLTCRQKKPGHRSAIIMIIISVIVIIKKMWAKARWPNVQSTIFKRSKPTWMSSSCLSRGVTTVAPELWKTGLTSTSSSICSLTIVKQ